MLTRRALLRLSVGLAAYPFIALQGARAAVQWRIPAEWAPHIRCWMAWPNRKDVWANNLAAVQRVCASIARAVSDFEPVTMVASSASASDAQHMCGPSVSVLRLPVDDCWMRDTGPLFATHGGPDIAGRILNFNGWGNKQPHAADAHLASRICTNLNMPQRRVPFVSEGGAWEFDGDGTALTTESALLDPKRNQHLTKSQVEAAALDYFGVEKIIWLPGANDYWTNGHIDGIARFVQPGHIVIERVSVKEDVDAAWIPRDETVLRSTTDARGRRFQVTTIQRPRQVRSTAPTFCNCYVNYYLANGAVIMARFGDEAHDARARDIIAGLYPGRRVVQLDIDALAEGGGGIHCVTLQQPVSSS